MIVPHEVSITNSSNILKYALLDLKLSSINFHLIQPNRNVVSTNEFMNIQLATP